MNFVPRFVCLIATLICGATGHAQTKSTPLPRIIDAEIQAAWQREKVKPAQPADESTFLRRIYLDLVGTIPSYEETVAYLKDSHTEKRAKLIDQLLSDPRFAVQQARVWDRILMGRRPRGEDPKRNELRKWLTDQFAANLPYDRLVGGLLLADGNVPGPNRFLAQYRNKPDESAMAVSRIFLGTQLQCAQCHDDRRGGTLTQKDFYGFAAFFVRLRVVDGVSGGKARLWIGEKSTGEMMFVGPAAEAVPGKKGIAIAARFLGGKVLEEPAPPQGFKEPTVKASKPPVAPLFSRRQKLTEWLTVKDNPYFARAAANRIWTQLMGRGLVHPVDDLRDKNRPSHPELFETLSEEFVAHGFDIKWLIRAIVNSKTYQLGPARTAEPTFWFEAAPVRPLTGEELLAALREATGFNAALRARGQKPETTKGQLDYFLPAYIPDVAPEGGEYQASLQERLFFDNSLRLRELLQVRKGNLTEALLDKKTSWEERIDRLFLTVLTRAPRPGERQVLLNHLTSKTAQTPVLVEEAIWSLLNTSEFRFNR